MRDILTIAIPVYNRSRFFKEALESALNQTIPTEVIVVDNASTEFDFKAFVEAYNCPRLKYYRNTTNLGMGGNWNRCIELCQTPYLLILHDDDVLNTSYAARLSTILPSRPDIVVTRLCVIDETGAEIGGHAPEKWEEFKHIEPWLRLNPGSVGAVFSVAAARAAGGFRTELKYTLDWDFWVRLAIGGKYHTINDTMGWYREYNANDRETSVLDKGCRLVSLSKIQARRNRAIFAKAYPERPLPECVVKRGLPWTDFIRMLPGLSRWRTKYILALLVRTPAPSLAGKLLRDLFRVAGRPLCSVLAFSMRGLSRYKS